MDCLKLALAAIAQRGQPAYTPDYSLTVREAAELIGCNVRTIRFARDRGELRGVKRGRHWRMCRHSVAAYDTGGRGRPRGGFVGDV